MSELPSSRMPAVFIGHGNPMYAITTNPYAERWMRLGEELPRPSAIVCVSAHWYVRGLGVTAMERPRTIHDFGGFPDELFRVQYPAPGSPRTADAVAEILRPRDVVLDHGWGLDHGAWAVLRHMYPQADVPIVQLSIDADATTQELFDTGRALRPLRDAGVLFVGSGNVVHNLRAYFADPERGEPYPWAQRFEDHVRSALDANAAAPIIDYLTIGHDAAMSNPTPDHFLPLVVLLGTRHDDDALCYPVQGFDGGALSMLSVRFG